MALRAAARFVGGIKHLISGNESARENDSTLLPQSASPHTGPRKRRANQSSMLDNGELVHKPYGNSIEELYKDIAPEDSNPLNAIAISDSDNEEITPLPNKTRLSAQSSTSLPHNSLRQERRRQITRSPTSSHEKRLLGGFIPNKDETIIPDPMKVQKHPGGLRPVNTLHSPNGLPQGRSDFHNRYTSRSLYDGQSRKTDLRENNHQHPSKKVRTGPSPFKGKTQQPKSISSADYTMEGFDNNPVLPFDGPINSSQTSKARLIPVVEIPRFQREDISDESSSNKSNTAISQSIHSRQNRHEVENRNSISRLNRSEYFSGSSFFPTDHDQNTERTKHTPKASNHEHVNRNVREMELDAMLSSSPEPSNSDKATGKHSAYFDQPRNNLSKDRQQVFHGKSTPRVKISYNENDSPDILHEEKAIIQSSNVDSSRIADRSRNLRTTGNSSAAKALNRTKKLPPLSADHEGVVSYDLHFVGYETLPILSAAPCTFRLDTSGKKFSIGLQESQLGDSVSISQPTSKIGGIDIFPGGDKIRLRCSQGQQLPKNIYLELVSQEDASNLQELLLALDANIKLHQKSSDWMDRAFDKVKHELDSATSKKTIMTSDVLDQQPPSSSTKSRYFASQIPGQKPMRAVDRLDAPASKSLQELDSVNNYRRRVLGNGVARGLYSNTSQTLIDNPAFSYTEPSSRETRSTRSRIHQEDNKVDIPANPPPIRYSATGQLGQPWKTPLVYPKNGKKRESVDFVDLANLDDEEFLNDNLINFFMRYLQDRMEHEKPEQLKKMYFFNSYFYDTLTKGKQGKKVVSYEAVAKWTKNVDIFSRDFVVVPVNENLHWFVAIICNLSSLLKPNQIEIDEGEHSYATENVDVADALDQSVIQDTPNLEDDHGQRTHETQKSFEDLSIHDNQGFRRLPTVLADDTTYFQNTTSARKAPGRKKSIRRSLPKHDIQKPIIITLDSLGISRSNICAVLKSYVVQEAETRKSTIIDSTEIKGMTAKGIPTQDNYSDCGLYVCMYIEQFMRDPYGFVARLLQREESQIRWPNSIYSHELRARLRELILDLHREQDGQPLKSPVPEVGEILINLREQSPDGNQPVVRKDASREQIRQLRQSFERRTSRDNRSVSAVEQPDRDTHELNENNIEGVRPTTPTIPEDQSLVIIDEPHPKSPSHPTPTDPSELAEYIRVQRSPPLRSSKRRRSDSASTDFLSGVKSYALRSSPVQTRTRNSGVKKQSREEKEVEIVEVDETQSDVADEAGTNRSPLKEIEITIDNSDAEMLIQ